MTALWDKHAAELQDTRQAERAKQEWKTCMYCGRRTLALTGVCSAHTDLRAIEELWLRSR